jgi:hypothetical protein
LKDQKRFEARRNDEPFCRFLNEETRLTNPLVSALTDGHPMSYTFTFSRGVESSRTFFLR